jgi:hypothetical protein
VQERICNNKITFIVHMGKFLESIDEKIPTFCGIKFTSNDLEEGFQALQANNHLTVFLGSDTVIHNNENNFYCIIK